MVDRVYEQSMPGDATRWASAVVALDFIYASLQRKPGCDTTTAVGTDEIPKQYEYACYG